MDELFTPQPGKSQTAKELWAEAYKPGTSKATRNALVTIANHVDAGLGYEDGTRALNTPDSAYEQLQVHYKGQANAEREAKEKADWQLLTDEEFDEVPEEYRGQVREIYEKRITDVFKQEEENRTGVRVKRGDPEWRFIQAAFDDPGGNLSETEIAVQEAARRKKQRLANMTSSQIRDQMYKK